MRSMAAAIALDLDSAEESANAPTPGTLQETVRRCVGGYLADLGDHQPDALYRLVLEQVEKPLLEEVMRWSGQNQSKTAEALGLSRGTLRKKLHLHGLN